MQEGENYYHPEQDPRAPGTEEEITWSASEYIAHQKAFSWYFMLALGTALLAAFAYFVTRDWVTVAVFIAVGGIFGYVGGRQPRTLNYSLSRHGIRIGDKFYPFEDFKSFSVIDEDAIYSILLLPMKRFMPGLNLYYPPEQEEEIMGALSSFLPHEMREADRIDRLMRRLRF